MSLAARGQVKHMLENKKEHSRKGEGAGWCPRSADTAAALIVTLAPSEDPLSNPWACNEKGTWSYLPQYPDWQQPSKGSARGFVLIPLLLREGFCLFSRGDRRNWTQQLKAVLQLYVPGSNSCIAGGWSRWPLGTFPSLQFYYSTYGSFQMHMFGASVPFSQGKMLMTVHTI